MKIKSMHLKHYRCFEDFSINFDDRLTVLVGVNGAGKTATLDALSVFLKGAGNSITTKNLYCYMMKSDVAIGIEHENMEYHLELCGNADDLNSIPVDLKFKTIGQNTIESWYVENISIIEQSKPVLAAYMAGRFVHESESILINRVQANSINPVYANNFDRKIDYASTLQWFSDVDADEARAMRDRGQKDELPELKAIREALTKALLGRYDRPSMQGSPPELIVYEKGTDRRFKVSQLSDGYRSMLALVMDLARRMAQSRTDEIKTEGSLLGVPAIVLIDEVELHLHPSWQQTVLTTLLEIFPNTQFIVTTHSPQVLTSIESRHIRILSEGKAYGVNEQTQGAKASQLLKHIFGVEPRPQNLEIVKILEKYSNLVYNDKWDTAEAIELRKTLDAHYGKDEPSLFELDLHIENKKWESGL